MRLRHPFTTFASLIGGLALVGLAACTPAAPVKADPISQNHAGYVMYPNSGKTFQQVHTTLIPPQFICLPKQNGTVRWYVAMDGIAGASNQNASAHTGLILGCKNGAASYIPFYGIYQAGKTASDQRFAPVRINPGDYVTVAVGEGFGYAEFQLGVGAAPGTPKRPYFDADIHVPSTQITGSAVGCLLEATSGASALPRVNSLGFDTSFNVLNCSAYTDLAGNGVFEAPNHGNQTTRGYNVTTKSGKALTRLDAFNYGLDGYFDIVER
jgi:hypothetical protein